MHKYLVLLVICVTAQLACGRPNPAAAYCERMGYEYRIVNEHDGARGVAVVAPGVEFDAWDFFKGKVGQEYSFAALHGYEIECVRTDEGGYIREYAVCYPVGARANTAHGIPLEELMRQKGLPLYDDQDETGKWHSGAGREADDADCLSLE